MGCNCNGTPPLGAGHVHVVAKAPPPPPPPKAPAPPPLTGKKQTFTLMTPDQRVQSFGSRLEAEAARVRSGGVGQITA